MIKIENQFAIILDFSSPENIDNIKQKLNLINDLEIYYKYLKKTKIMVKPTSTYLIKGSDDQSIVERISNYFKIQNLNITEIDTFVEPAPVTGSPLFNIKVTVEHSSTTNSETVDKDLIQICKQLNLTLK
jgi:glycine cleavage system regulatory protein